MPQSPDRHFANVQEEISLWARAGVWLVYGSLGQSEHADNDVDAQPIAVDRAGSLKQEEPHDHA